MKSLNSFMRVVLNELGTRCGTSTTRDLKTISRRFEHEGISFFTISLPKFGKDFQKSLDQGSVDRSQFQGFAFTGGLPQLFGGFLDLVFDRRGGRLLDVPSIEAITAIRQLTLMFAKINLDCSDERKRRAFDKYIECEGDIRHYDQLLHTTQNSSKETIADSYGRIGRLLWAGLFSRIDSRLYREGVLPRHGSGATADRLSGNRKWDSALWSSRLEAMFPHWDYMAASPSFCSRTDELIFSDPGSEIPVKVILVPKTLETPRVIAMEPTCMQYVQQGLLRLMTQEFEADDNASNFVKSDSQSPNQEMALRGSIDGSLATLDLSEASDRVSNQHVRLLLANHGLLAKSVDACRSRKADVNGKVFRLAKFASMGSALCFPFEALVFTTVVFVGIEQKLNRRLTKKDIKLLYGLVRVYGDDIIVPVDYVQTVLEALETFGFKVSVNKSFWTGKFRESCGKDYYDGHDVSIVRVRSMFPRNRRQVSELISTVSLRNQLFSAGYVETVDWLDRLIGDIIPFPYVESTSTLLGRHTTGPCQADGYDYDLHLPIVKGVHVVSRLPDSKLDDHGALLKFFLKTGEDPYEKDHLALAGRSVSARIKSRWAPPW